MNDPNTIYRAPLHIGDIAPDFTARSTHGTVQLSGYQGRWLIFFSHPADFTPVCTSEFVGLAKLAGEFEGANCALLGLSVDSLYAHLAWITAIEDSFGIKIPFPVIEDPSMAIGNAYGMIDEHAEDSAAMRSAYFIDPHGIVRAIITYPHNVGRSADEMLRLVRALQAADKSGHFTPEGWQPGDPLLMPPPENIDQAKGQDGWYRLADKE